MEVRSITPNYTNNQTSFGMAFKKPNTEAIEDFTQYITRKGHNPVRLTKRGVAKIIERHSKDRHFDFVYTEAGKFEIIPKTAKGKEMMDAGTLPQDILSPRGILEKARAANERINKAYDEAEGFEVFRLGMKQFFIAIKARLGMELKPVDSLPRGIRNTSAKVQACETAVEKQLAKEAKEAAKAEKIAAKKAKAAEKLRIAKEKQAAKEAMAKQKAEIEAARKKTKAISEIESVFEPKKK